MKSNSIVLKMMTPLIMITVVVLALTIFITQTYLKEVVEDIFIDFKVNQLKKMYTQRVEFILDNVKKEGLAIAQSYEIQNFLNETSLESKTMPLSLKEKMSQLKALYGLDTIYAVSLKTKNYYNETGYLRKINPLHPESQWFNATLASKKKYLINADSDITGKLHIWNDAIVTKAGKVVGMAGCGIDISTLLSDALSSLSTKDATAVIIDEKNIIQAYTQKNIQLYQPLDQMNVKPEKREAILNAKQTGQDLMAYDGNHEKRYLLFFEIKEIGWTIIVDFSKERFLEPIHGVYGRMLLGAAVLLVLLLLIGGLTFSYVVSRPLKSLSKAVNEFDYSSDFHPQSCQNMGYEVDMICKAFNASSSILRQTLQEHKDNEELLRNIIDAADDFVFFKNSDHVYIGCNQSYAKWKKTTVEEIVGKTDDDLYEKDIANYHKKMDALVLQQNRTMLVEEKFEEDDGSIKILEVKKSPFYDNKGNTRGVLVMTRDVTEMKRLEQDLRRFNMNLEQKVYEKTQMLERSNASLEEHIQHLESLNKELIDARRNAMLAAQARSNFVTSISHELRTPLNAIINFTDQVIEDFEEMKNDEILQKENKEFLTRVMVNSKHLLQLINDLLEFTKAEAGKIEYNIQNEDINEIIQMAYNNSYSLLSNSNVVLKLTLSVTPLMAPVDKRRFLQILLNLLSNAIKFTEKGSIEIRSFELHDAVLVEIEDTGRGIALEKQEQVFDPFVQVHSSDQGTGLGLGLVKRMCEDMDIDVSFTSVEDEGTVFHLGIKKAAT